MNSSEIEKHIEAVLQAIGEDPTREGLIDTPKRVAKSYEKLFSGYNKNPAEVVTVFDNEGYDEMVIARDIEFYSFCEHHMIPFFGKAHIGYIPNDKIIGVSKMPRILEIFARRLQNQERLTSQVANSLMELLKPKGVGVVLEAKHLCMMARGVEKQNSMMVTSTVRGLFKKNLNTRTEFLRLIGKV
ncbi:GTP cyclohydrolase I FolE [Candidatus Peregrinibacteria bacterium]|jgi:GTP cyclohydrolase IA|nr:GTP cyclohydrolase I FolE [Candidatus Peregrinibacteria bacterium]MBT7483564.1 GTP cyclohydrolase I FolE [Candidatus Peregrinibacteria bacterium]MBT7703344.1 GTP cyclohydrolase I FolE [Candidatus Peregrinibacteria bacterium]